jgi:hypothetical protein
MNFLTNSSPYLCFEMPAAYPHPSREDVGVLMLERGSAIISATASRQVWWWDWQDLESPYVLPFTGVVWTDKT